jgi:hypothetical protein
MKGSWRQRCGARAKHKTAHAAGKFRGLSYFCRRWAVPGKQRCRLHGGLSTGPRTPEGKAASRAAGQRTMLEGRRRRIAELALEGKKINGGHNGGRYPKDWPMTPDGKPVKRDRTRQRILEELASMAAPELTPEQEAMARRIVAESDRVQQAAAIEQEIAERRRLMNLLFRGADSAASRHRDEALIARAREAGAELQRRWRRRHE